MFRPRMKLLLLGVAIVALVSIWTPSAQAHWGYWGWGGYPAWTVGYSGCCDGWYLGVRPGPIRRLVLGPYRWYYGGWGSYYTSCYSYAPCCSACWCSPCCCWDTCSVTVSTYPAPEAPAPQAQPTPAPQQPPAQPPALPPDAPKPADVEPQPPRVPSPGPVAPLPHSFYEPTRADSGLLTVYVPYEAKVFINGLETKATGSRRQYVSFGLAPGLRYKYEVRAEIEREGKILEETKTIYLTAGGREGLAFGFNPRPDEGLAAAQ